MWKLIALRCFPQDVVLTFMARQQGSFQVCQTLDVLGQVPQSSDGKDVSELELRSFHTLTLQMSAACHGEATHTCHVQM